MLWFWQTLAALLSGILVVAAFREAGQRLVVSMSGETTLGALPGFATFLVVPVAAGIHIVTLVGLRIGIAGVLLFGLALYGAKLPTAVWLGGRLLGCAGRADASPHKAMALGILLLNLLFAASSAGVLLWLVAAWLGLGAMVVSGCRHLNLRARSA